MRDDHTILAESLYKVLDGEISEEIKQCGIQHIFSPGFEKKMRRLIKQQKRFYFPIVKTGMRKTAAIILVMILMMFGAVMSVEAWRNAFFSFITRPFDTHTDVEAVKKASAPDIIAEVYEPGYIPEGFTLSDRYYMEKLCVVSSYTNGKDRFDLEQWVRSEYSQGLNTEGYDMEPAEINGCEGFIIDMEDVDMCVVSWDSGGCIFQLTGSIGRDTLIKIAESVRITESSVQ